MYKDICHTYIGDNMAGHKKQSHKTLKKVN